MTQVFDRLGFHALTVLEKFLLRLPESTAQFLGKGLGMLAYLFVPRRSVAFADLKKAFQPRFSDAEIKKILRKHYRHLGQMLVETLRMDLWTQDKLKKQITITRGEIFEKAIADSRGIIFLTAHFGNWELSQVVSDGIFGQPIYVLGQAQKHPRMNDFLTRLREKHGSKAIEVGMGIRGLFKALKEKKTVGILGDNSPGRNEGLIVPFLGRKTTVATGAFELAQRTGAVLIPVFIIRTGDGRHELCFEPAMEFQADAKSVEPAVRTYVKTLESYIEKYPDQWLWEMKRWKYSWTKRILVLSDGKAGHEKQSQAVAERFLQNTAQYSREGLEFPLQTAQIRFKSVLHRRIFPWAAWLVLPWAQRCQPLLGHFIDKESMQHLASAGADFVISAGSHLAPLNLFLSRGVNAKSVILMNPGFPYCLFRYDLALIPAHDRGLLPRRNLRLLLTPGPFESSALKQDAEKLRPGLKAPEKIKFAVFLGGETRRYKMAISSIEIFYSIMQRTAEKHGDYLITVSRRTPPSIVSYLKQRIMRDPRCQLFVDPKTDSRKEVVGGMMELAQVLIVTEDSISMISEAVLSRKKVIVVTFGGEGLPAKHGRFRKLLADRGAVQIVEPRQLEAAIDRISSMKAADDLIDQENEKLSQAIRELL